MKVFGKSVMLTRRHNRHGGDHNSDLGLVVDYRGVLSIYGNADGAKLYQLTSQPKYVAWLLENSMDLLEMCNPNCPHGWYNDKQGNGDRRAEFMHAIESLYEFNH